MILIIDISGSMDNSIYNGPGIVNGKKKIDLAREAATTVIKTLGLSDFVGVITFSDDANILIY